MIERVIVMNTKPKSKRQNWGSHLKNIQGSAFRRAWISQWLDDPDHEGKHYKDAVKAYIEHKTNIAIRWAEPVEILLNAAEPCVGYDSYQNLLKASKDNVDTVRKALTATDTEEINYEAENGEKWEPATTSGWMKEEEKYFKELTNPSGKTGKWINALAKLCEDFKNLTSEEEIVPELKKIIKHCTYTAGDPEKNDKLPLYMYPQVQTKYAQIAERLTKYSNFVNEEITNGHENKTGKSSES